MGDGGWKGWLGMSLLVSLYFAGVSLCYALSHSYLIQDDARQHIAWMQQFVLPDLFPNDWLVQYYRSVSPAGYKVLYWLFAQVGIAPLLLAKLLPIGLGLITTVYLFQVTLLILPVPFAACLSTIILNQLLWLSDNLVSATPRAFVYPIFTAFLYYLLRRSLIPCLITIALQGLFFPQLLLVQLGVLTMRLFRVGDRSITYSRALADYQFWLAGIGVGIVALLPMLVRASQFGALIQAAQMRSMPEYGSQGRSKYFGVGLINFILNRNSGLRIPIFPSIALAGFGLPLLHRPLPLVDRITPQVHLLTQVILSSLGLFLLAHLLLLRLYFPSRYTYHTLRIVLSIAAGIVFASLLTAGWRSLRQARAWTIAARLRVGLVGLALAIVLLVPMLPALILPFQGWIVGQSPALYQFLTAQPQDTLVASLSAEADNLPAFAGRSTLVGREFAIPHHPLYYRQIQQRAIDVIRLQYSADRAEVRDILDRYGIDFLLIDRAAFAPTYLQTKDWLFHSSFRAEVDRAIAAQRQGVIPTIVPLIDRCSVVTTRELVLLRAECLRSAQKAA